MQRALAVQRELRGNEPHPDLAEVLNDMGFVLDENGDLDNAEKFYRESLAMYRRLLGDKHPYVATELENVAFTAAEQGRFWPAPRRFCGSRSRSTATCRAKTTRNSGERCSISPLCSTTAAKPARRSPTCARCWRFTARHTPRIILRSPSC